MLAGLFGWLKRPRRRETTELEFVHSRSRFRDILEVERMRSDRTGSPFALAIFTLPKAMDDAERVAFGRHLERRRRATDHVGLVHDRHLGVVLWNTSEEGAWTFAEDAVAGWERRCVESEAAEGTVEEGTVRERPEVEVFMYPTHVAPSDGEGPKSTKRPVGAPEEVAEEVAERAAAPEALESVEFAMATRRETKSLETLFVRPLPFWKRAVDVLGATFGLVVLSPLLLTVAALVKFTSRGPIFFCQRRTGHGGREFTIYKFRTMCVDAEAKKDALLAISEQDGPAFKLSNDPRITGIGRFLRKTCIDELPQLWNVLVGDMTLVGPRPLEVGEANQTTGWERRRLDVTPGLTCIWQVEGKSRVTFAEWMRMDIRYARVGSFAADVRLVVRTLLAMIRLKASQ